MQKKSLYLILLCFLSALTLWLAQIRRDQFALARQIAPQLLRFHVIANSKSPEDQEIKLKVKSFLLERIYQSTTPSDGSALSTNPPLTKDDLKSTLLTQKASLEKDTRDYIRQLGKDYPVSLDISTCEFPEKYYGNIRLPAGYYETAELKIGNARGHNWWCVLYPKICITKDAVAIVPDSSLEELRQLLTPEDYQQLLLQRPALTPTTHCSFYMINLLKGNTSLPATPSAHPDH